MKLADIKRALAEHAALSENDRYFDKAPVEPMQRRCKNCGRALSPIPIGWKELEWAAAKGEDIPESMDVRDCTACEDKEEDDDEG